MQQGVQLQASTLKKVPSEVTEMLEHLALVLDELEQQRWQAQVIPDQIERVEKMNNHLVLMMTLRMPEQINISLREQDERLRALSEQHSISLEQLEGYLLHQQTELQRIKRELEVLQVTLADQQQLLLAYQSRLEQLQGATSK